MIITIKLINVIFNGGVLICFTLIQSVSCSDVSTQNLIYLSADQALADAAYFIKGMNTEHRLAEGTKWVVFGGSYAANLAAWMRDKYSHLVYAAVADSGPILAKVNFYGKFYY